MRLGVAEAVVGDRVVPGDVQIDGGAVESVGLDPPGSGIAVPGFIDVHTHGFAGVDFATADDSMLARAAKELARTGVTTFLPSLISLPEKDTLDALGRIGRAASEGARIFGAHLEGPFLSAVYPGAHDPSNLREPDLQLVESFLRAGPVRHMTLAPELPGAIQLIEDLVARGVVVSLGHSDASAEVANRAFDAGASALTHVFNAARPLRHRDPGLVGVALTRPDVFVEMILDGVHLGVEASTIVLRTAADRLVLVTDALAASGLGDGTYTLGDREVVVADGEARLDDGTIASSSLTMDQAFRALLGLAGDLTAAVRATSTAPAHLIGRPELGTLEPGTPADVVVIGGAQEVIRTLVGGMVVYEA